MEDQSTDSGDLSTEAASVPQGKAARSRHRLPRQKAAEPGQTEDAVAEDSEAQAPEAGVLAAKVPDADLPDAGAPDAGAPDAGGPDAGGPDAGAPGDGAPGDDVSSDDVLDTELAAETLDTETEPQPEPVLIPHRPAGRGLKLVAVAVAVLFVAAAAFAGAMIQPYLADRAAVQTKFAIAETAANAITTLWTYTPDDMDQLPNRSAKYLGGDFAADYKRYIDAIVAPNKQAQVTNNTQVLGAAVESLTPTDATAIVYTNSVATSPVTKGIPSLRYLSYRLKMKRDENRWLITEMVAVTKLDLTPRL